MLVAHGHISLNGKHCDVPSLLVRPGDVVAVKPRPRGLQLVKLALQEKPTPIPEYMEMVTPEPPAARVGRMPTRGDVDPRIAESIREQLIIELANR